jgi:hypothetical protein
MNEGFLIDEVGSKEKIQKVYNEMITLHTRLPPKEHSPFTLEHSLVTILNYSKNYLSFLPLRAM